MPAGLGNPAESGNGRQRRRRDREPVALSLAVGASVAAAARHSGVAERTVRGWLQDPSFRRRVSELRSELFDAAVGHLAASGRKAAKALADLLDSANEGVRLRAAAEVLSLGPKLREAAELAERVAELEALVKASKR